jgi:hypothetical protein
VITVAAESDYDCGVVPMSIRDGNARRTQVDNTLIVKVVAGALFVIVLAVIIMRRKKKVA